MQDKRNRKINGFSDDGHCLVLSSVETNNFQHYAGGIFDLTISGQFPNGTWFYRLINLDLCDPVLSPLKSPLAELPIIHTWDISNGRFKYFVLKNGVVEVPDQMFQQREIDFPYPHYPQAFPRTSLMLAPLTQVEQKIIKTVNRTDMLASEFGNQYFELDDPRHQLFGEPILLQKDFSHPICLKCQREMKFLLAVSTESFSDIKFFDSKHMQLLYFFCVLCGFIESRQDFT